MIPHTVMQHVTFSNSTLPNYSPNLNNLFNLLYIGQYVSGSFVLSIQSTGQTDQYSVNIILVHEVSRASVCSELSECSITYNIMQYPLLQTIVSLGFLRTS